MIQTRRQGFTLVEVLIVVVIMAVLAATIIPQFSDSSKDAKMSTAKFNLHTLRSQVELYKSQHDGKLPSDDLAELLIKTNVKGNTNTGDGPLVYGPYIQKIPANPFNNSDTFSNVTTKPATAPGGAVGWVYDTDDGLLWINEAGLWDE